MKIKSILSFQQGLLLIAIITSSLLWSGCGEAEGPGQKVGDYTISLRVKPDPAVVGLNTFRIKVLDASDSPVEDATVHIHYSMPAMAGMPAMSNEIQTQHAGDGAYEAQIDLSSGGKFTWDLRVEVARDQKMLTVTQWQVTPETKGVKYVSGESGGSGEGEIEYYTCTMHPSVKEKEPGTCPICAMDLTPVYKEGAQSESEKTGNSVRTVNIPLYQQQLIGVQIDTVKLMAASKKIRTVGRVDYDETKIATVNLKFSGWIEELHVDYVGQFVKKGQPLFSIYSPELVSTQEELLQVAPQSVSATEASADTFTRSLYQTTLKRLQLWGLSQQLIEQIMQNKKPLLRIEYDSPFTGYVIAKNILLGQHAKAGMDLYKIADLSRIWVFADIYEQELTTIEMGQQAKLTLSYNTEMALVGKVDYIYPSIDRETRTAKIRLVFPNPDLRLKPDMYANVELAIDLREQLVVPETAVLSTGKRQLVFVDHGNGRFEPRKIKTGRKVERYYTILEGLKAGEVVVKSGNFLIDAEAHVQGVVQSMEK